MESDVVEVPAPSDATSTLRELRRTRQRRRLGDTDWYDIAYRVYLFALVGLVVVVWVSDAIDGVIGDTVDTQDLLTRGPAVIGLLVVVAFGLGLRSGADGGPIAIEVADIRHVLLAPISQRSVMLRPIGQRLRSATFAVGLSGAVLGQLIAQMAQTEGKIAETERRATVPSPVETACQRPPTETSGTPPAVAPTRPRPGACWTGPRDPREARRQAPPGPAGRAPRWRRPCAAICR